VVTPVGKSPVRDGDWLLVPYVTIPGWAKDPVDAAADAYVQSFYPHYDQWSPPSYASFPSGFDPADPLSVAEVRDAAYAVNTLKAPCAVIGRVKKVWPSGQIELYKSIPIVYQANGAVKSMYAVLAASGIPGVDNVLTLMSAHTPSLPAKDLPVSAMLSSLAAYKSALTYLEGVDVGASTVSSIDGLLAYMGAQDLDEIVWALRRGWFDRFFLASSGSSVSSALVGSSAAPTQIFGDDGDTPEGQGAVSLNPNTDAVEYLPDEEDDYGG
jgi:hypothetical protein